MKKLNLLSKAEMRKVMGGVMDKETTLQYCLDHIRLDGASVEENEIILSVAPNMCWQAYNEMIH